MRVRVLCCCVMYCTILTLSLTLGVLGVILTILLNRQVLIRELICVMVGGVAMQRFMVVWCLLNFSIWERVLSGNCVRCLRSDLSCFKNDNGHGNGGVRLLKNGGSCVGAGKSDTFGRGAREVGGEQCGNAMVAVTAAWSESCGVLIMCGVHRVTSKFFVYMRSSLLCVYCFVCGVGVCVLSWKCVGV